MDALYATKSHFPDLQHGEHDPKYSQDGLVDIPDEGTRVFANTTQAMMQGLRESMLTGQGESFGWVCLYRHGP